MLMTATQMSPTSIPPRLEGWLATTTFFVDDNLSHVIKHVPPRENRSRQVQANDPGSIVLLGGWFRGLCILMDKGLYATDT